MKVEHIILATILTLALIGTYSEITGAYTAEKYADNEPLPGQPHSIYKIKPAYVQPLDLETYVQQILTHPLRPPLLDITYDEPLQDVMLCTACYDGKGLCKPRPYQPNIGYCPGIYLENNQPCTCPPPNSRELTRPVLQSRYGY